MTRRRAQPSSTEHAHATATALEDTARRRIWLLETLHDVNAKIAASDDIEGSLQDISSEISRRFKFSTVAIGVVQGDEIVFHGVTPADVDSPFHIPLSAGVCGRVIRNGSAELVQDVSADPDFVLVGGDARREVAAPIFVDGSVYGVLNVEAPEGSALGAEEFDVMKTVATSLGVAIERFRQRRSETLRLERLSALQRVTGLIAGRERVEDHVADILLEITRAFDFDFVSLGFLDGDQLYFQATFDVYVSERHPSSVFPASTGITGRVARTGIPAFVPDVRLDPDFVGVRDATAQEICVPIYSGGAVIGVLNVEMSNRRQLDQGDFDIVQSLGDHLGLAMSNQRRVEELERRNEQLRTVERVTAAIAGTLLIREALADVLVELERGFGFGTTGVGLIEGDRLVFHAIRERGEGPTRSNQYVTSGIPLGRGVTGRVAITGEPALIHDISQDPDYLPTAPGIKHEACVPIRAGGRIAGVLNVETGADRPLTEHDAEILSVIADHIGIAIQRSNLYEAEQESRRAIEAMQRVSTIVASTLDVDEALQLIVRTLSETFGYPLVTLQLLHNDLLTLAAHAGELLPGMRRSISIGEGIAGRVARTGVAELVEDAQADAEYLQAQPGITSEVCVPIFCDGELAGVLNIEGNDERPVTAQDLELMTTFAQHAGAVLQNARSYARMQELATRDPVTGLANHREFQIRLRAEIARASRSNRALGLLLIDLDSFKRVNDSHGHVVGDHLLRDVAQRLSGVMRDGDMLARYGGDEFVAILADADGSAAARAAERLASELESRPFALSNGGVDHVWVSIGAASFPEDGASAESLIDRADRSMYERKRDRAANGAKPHSEAPAPQPGRQGR